MQKSEGNSGKVAGKGSDLEVRVNVLESALEAMTFPFDYTVVAMFRFKDEEPPELSGLGVRERHGLPSAIKHRTWPCPMEPCRVAGNMQWVKGFDAKNEIPKGTWPWSHVAMRTFPSSDAANQWLANSPEGQFITDHAEIVFTTVVYGQHRLI